MARRKFMPALQRAIGRSPESKTLTISGYSGVRPMGPTVYGNRDSAAGYDIQTVIQDGYERVVWVFNAVEVIAGNASRLPFRITVGDDENEVENHALLRLMNKQANPHETGRQFRKRLSMQVLLSKRGAFVELTRTRGGVLSRLDLLPPDRIVIVPDAVNGDYVDHFEHTTNNGTVRALAPERVRWIREPHPLDPFSGTTPMDAAGMSVELDHLARAYNVSFINRDGRPGGILGVSTDGLPEEELDRIQRRTNPGAYFAGEMAVLGTGPGGLSYVDTSARPRDMAYETLTSISRKEILAAFRVPLSMVGDANDSTYQNSEQDEFNFWQDPMIPHLDLVSGAFDTDVDEDMDCGYDLSEVEALELPSRKRRAEAREEFNAGLRSIDEYRPLTDDLEVLENPQSRALWVSPAKAPIPGRAGDEEALGLGIGGVPGDPNAAPKTGGTAADAVAAASQQNELEGTAPVGASSMVDDGDAATAVLNARSDARALVPTVAAETVNDARMLERKSLDAPDGEYDPGEDALQRTELAVAAALEAMLARQVGVITARLESPKSRMGTKYWTTESKADTRGGDGSINAEKIVDPPRWAAETQETLRPLLTPAAQESAGDTLAALAATGVLVTATGTAADIGGRAVAAPTATAAQVAAYAAQTAIAPVMLGLVMASEAVTSWLESRIVDIDRLATNADGNLATLTEQIKKLWADKSRGFAQSLAIQTAQAAVSGGRDAAVQDLRPNVPATSGTTVPPTPDAIQRFWQTRQDERVRETHEDAQGQMRHVGEPFTVGGYDLRWPSDPLAPPSVSRNCRCWVRYQWPSDAQFTLPGGK